MPTPACPHCQMKLTSSEFAQPRCPLCGGKLKNRNPQSNPVHSGGPATSNATATAKTKVKPNKWLIFGLGVVGGVVGAIVEALATGLKGNGQTGAIVGVAAGTTLAQAAANRKQQQATA